MIKVYKYILWFVPFLMVIFVYSLGKPKEIDWRKTFDKDHKIPNGCYITYNRLPDFFPGSNIETIDKTTFISINPGAEGINLIYITEYFEPTKTDINTLFKFAENGNNIFISAEDFSEPFLDSLNVSIDPRLMLLHENSSSIIFNELKTTVRTEINYKNLFALNDSSNVEVIAKMDNHLDTQAVYIKKQFNEGSIYLSLLPESFTNNYLLNINDTIAALQLSYLPPADIYWDEYYKPYHGEEKGTITQEIMKRPPLKWAYYLALTAIFLFMFFEGKRKQRVIPKMEKPVNSTLEFVYTIGRLFYTNDNNKSIAEMRIGRFWDFIVTNYSISRKDLTFTGESGFAEKLAEKSGLDTNEIDILLDNIFNIHKSSSISNKELLEFNGLLHNFYTKTKRL